jgi:gliding motility-associated-like protein
MFLNHIYAINMKSVFLAFLFLACQHIANATHIVGGEITYKCLGNDLFEIKLSVYRDCFNGVPPFDDPASIGITDASFEIDTALSFLLNWNKIDDTLVIYLNNPCLTQPPDICVHRTTYTAVISLPPRPGGYFLIYQRCCRNQLIRNIPDPENVGITIITQINDTAYELCNNSAVYNNWPPLAICVHEPVDFDHSASDPDGDSLAYRLCTPLDGAEPNAPMPQPPNSGPYIEVIWQSPYDLTDLLGGDPLKIDPYTGFMTGIPNTIGNFVVGVCVDEFRNGALISTTRRDFQYNVADCGVPVAAYQVPELLCDSLSVQFNNKTDLNALGISNWYFDWGGDLSLFSNQYSPAFSFPDTGHYQVALIVNPGYSCSDTLIQEIWMTSTQAEAALELKYTDCDSTGVTVRCINQSTDPQFGITAVNWFVTGPNNFTFTSSSNKPEFKVTEPGTYYVLLTAIGGNGCSDETTFSFVVPFALDQLIAETYSICAGESIGLYPDASSALTYAWSPSPDISNLALANPVVSPSITTTYTVTITQDGSPCEWKREVGVNVLANGALSATANPTTILPGEYSQLLASFPVQGVFSWMPDGSLSNSHIINPIATPTLTTDYTVIATATSGCTQAAQVRVIVLNPVCGEPFIFFPTGFSPNGDGENEFLKMEGRFTTEVYWMIYNRWGEKIFEARSIDDQWDGMYKGQSQPAETYGYYYRIVCQDGTVKEQKGNVTLIR